MFKQNNKCTRCGCSSCQCGDRTIVRPNPINVNVEQIFETTEGPTGPTGDIYVPVETNSVFTSTT